MSNNKQNITLSFIAGFLTMLLISVILFVTFIANKPSENPLIPNPTATSNPEPNPVKPSPAPSQSPVEGVLPPEDTLDNVDNSRIQAVIGMSEENGTRILTEAGWTVRVVARNGENFIITADYSTSRANLVIENNIIVEAEIY